MKKFNHIDTDGNVKMVDVTEKTPSVRIARAEGKIMLNKDTINAILNDSLPKGNVLSAAKIAGIS